MTESLFSPEAANATDNPNVSPQGLWGALYPKGYGGGLFGQTPMLEQVNQHAQQRAELARQLIEGGATPKAANMQAFSQNAADDPMANNLAGFGGIMKPIRAFHGSPHNFDKFDTSKIGTGEGAQAYGHGLYFAENESVAKAYRDTLARTSGFGGQDFHVSVGGKVVKKNDLTRDQQTALFLLKDAGGDLAKAKQVLSREYQPTAQHPVSYELDRLTKMGVEFVPPGRMYEVNLHADPQRMLDWDKPLTAQSADVQKNLLAKFSELSGKEVTPEWVGTFGGSGDQLNNLMSAWTKHKPAATSSALEGAGIPGIRYLDQGSRGAAGGTSNYVIFDPSIIEIVRKYGIPGAAVAGGGYSISADAAQALGLDQETGGVNPLAAGLMGASAP